MRIKLLTYNVCVHSLLPNNRCPSTSVSPPQMVAGSARAAPPTQKDSLQIPKIKVRISCSGTRLAPINDQHVETEMAISSFHCVGFVSGIQRELCTRQRASWWCWRVRPATIPGLKASRHTSRKETTLSSLCCLLLFPSVLRPGHF